MSDAERGDPVELEMTVADGRTEIRVSGDRDTAVVVRSASGEKVYLPPEDFERPPERDRRATDSPYQPGSPSSSGTGSGDSPYQSAGGIGSPYQSGRPSGDSPYQSGDSSYQSAPDADTDPETGLRPTADGYLVVHPEPVTDLRFLR